MSYSELMEELEKRGVSEPHRLVLPEEDHAPIKAAIAEFDRKKRKGDKVGVGLLIYMIRNGVQPRKVNPGQREKLIEAIRMRCLALEGNVRWAIEEEFERAAINLDTTARELVDEAMWPEWEETPMHPAWANKIAYLNEREYEYAVRWWTRTERWLNEVRDQARLGTDHGSTGLSCQSSDERDERQRQDH